MDTVHKLETQLSGLFKDLPALPENAKEFLVKAWPYLALIAGLVQLLAAWGLWSLFSASDRLINGLDRMAAYYGTTPSGYNAFDKTVIFIGIAILAVQAVIFLMAYAPLMKRAKKGWDLIFLIGLLNVVYAVVQIFMQGSGIGGAIGSLIGSAIGFYLLFQIRSKYGVHGHVKTAKTHPHTPAEK